MIRLSKILAIEMALCGLAPVCLGQESGQPPAGAASTKPTTTTLPARSRPTDPALEKAVRATVDGYVAAYNQRNATALATFFTEDATLIDSENNATSGREAITQEFADSFAEPSTYTLRTEIERVRPITRDVAEADGVARLVAPKEATIAKRFVAILARQNESWKIAEIRDYPAPANTVTPSERLKELEWMIGEWVDESEDVQITSIGRWGQNKAFLIRDFSVKVKGEPDSGGLMILAWDPQLEQIKSWIINADGGRGEGTWTRATDTQWVVKAHGSTGDGLGTSATQVISLINKDAIRTSSTERIVGGELARDVEDVIMVRKPPAPAGSSSPTTSRPAR